MGITHLISALVLQGIIGFLTGNLWIGAAFGAALYVGREQAQAEYRWIETYGAGRRANMPWWGGYDPRVWNKKSLLDFIVPTIGVVLVAIFL